MKMIHFLILALAVCLFFGCNNQSTTEPAADSAHDHHLESLSAGIDQLKGFRDEVKTAFDAGKPSDCDNALHEAAHVLEALPEAADVGELSAEDQTTVKATSKELFDLFMKIHDGFHGGTEVETNAYDAVAADIDAALAKLSSIAVPATP